MTFYQVRLTLLSLFLLFGIGALSAQRTEVLLEKGWKFIKGEQVGAEQPAYDDRAWQSVTVPHDWAIYGPFDGGCDVQHVAITQNQETQASLKTGRTGGLPYMGVGWYRCRFDVPQGKEVSLIFDGAMSDARVYVNGKQVAYWPYGYNSFHCDVTEAVRPDGKNNVLSVRLENQPQSSRWYPGAGLYRNVHVVTTEKVHVPVWGTYITTPHVAADFASVRLQTRLLHVRPLQSLRVVTEITSPQGQIVARKDRMELVMHDSTVLQNLIVERPMLWSPEHPHLYHATTRIYVDSVRLVDTYTTRFGIRTVEVVPERGFYLNGERRKFRGVCNHHDLGPLGAAVNRAALRHQLLLLKDMGCDAIRTSHNMPAPELVELCDEMGFMMMVEPFDEWDLGKVDNGYHRLFAEWGDRDLLNMLHHYRNAPSVVMWSIGNEVPTQCRPDGYKLAHHLQDICHREDPTRPVTCGMDQVSCVLDNGFASVVDVPGFNYRAHRYEEGYRRLPQNMLLGCETASTVSSRGVYKFPVVDKDFGSYDDHQSSSYDVEAGSWCNLPDPDFALAEDHEWTMGQFVWTGFDYLGEPYPYDTNGWPSHSSYFGIIDLASLPKDRFYLYRSQWNKSEPTLHVLPHWTWPGREGEVTPVFVYTSYPAAELFINGKSMGIQRKSKESLKHRFRLMWREVKYEPGELKVVAYDEQGRAAAEEVVRTAGKPHHLVMESAVPTLQADGKDLAYITVKVVDKEGRLCPADGRLVSFEVSGAGSYRAGANGDPACLDLFHEPRMHLFSGMLTAIVQSGEVPGQVEIKASAKGLRPATLTLQVK